jgi:general secretion pathway protein E
MLHVIYRLPRVVHEAICTRIKALSRLDVAEKRRPQDGRIKVNWKDEDAEIRVSTVPVAFGEKVVLRIQNAEILFSDLDELGFSKEDLARYKRFLEHTYGIVLITGPTGSGKSTTLYSTLRHLNSPELNIVTIEDPIEMVFEDFNQIAVQPSIDVTFSSILRNILRQDPDIVMIGEIRDGETARYAVQAALTGHLVFSTLHTNDAAGAITRMRDLGLESYLISSTLLGVVAQRLVRMICPECKTSYRLPASRLSAMGCRIKEEYVTAYRGEGCRKCRNTGYYGRIGVYEVLEVTDEIKRMIHLEDSELAIKKKALAQGMKVLKYDACMKMLAGITTFEEILRVTA